MNDHYMQQFKKVLYEVKWVYTDLDTPVAIAGHWKNFVEGCQGVYGGSVFDFDEGVIFRTMTEKILQHAEMLVYPAFKDFVDAMHEADNAFSALTIEARAGEFWWERALLRHTGKLYQEQIQLYYGITLP